MKTCEISSCFGNIYKNKNVLITGHTGFKGSWLALWLSRLGANVTGISLAPETNPNHFKLLNIDITNYETDIRNLNKISEIFNKNKPEIVFHLAAQALVRRSYREPVQTFEANVLGAANILEACRLTPSVKAIVVITSDKCYENKEWPWGYRETDQLGGHDPYSASKACTEIVAASYMKSFLSEKGCLLSTVRAGNVIGGGDWSEDRLIPDLVRATSSNQNLIIRYPHATRPWQHVLEPLSGYLLIGKHLLEGNSEMARSWNFGPGEDGNCTVEELLIKFKENWHNIRWDVTPLPQPKEAGWLQLDISLARRALKWKPVWNLNEAIKQTSLWYKTFYNDSKAISEEQILNFTSDAKKIGAVWR